MILDPKNALTKVVMLVSAAVAASGNSLVVDLKDFIGRVSVLINHGPATAGSSPTYDYALHSGNESNGANSVALNINATQIVNANNGVQELALDTRALPATHRYVKLVGTIGGTSSPSFPIGAVLIGTK